MEKILEVQNITAYRGETRVFHELSLDISRGSNTVILGPNGAGKSTLLQLVTRELYPVQQEDSYLRLFGRERWNIQELRGRLGIVSHDLQTRYLGRARGAEVILSGLYSSIDIYRYQEFADEDRRRADRIMDRLDISELSERAFSALSTGQQRRFLLGRALINDPDVLVLDEPTNSLDLTGTFKYLATLRSLIRRGRTVILATHHIHEIPPEIDRVVLLKEGAVMADGPTSEVLTDEHLSKLFDTSVRLVHVNGYYQAVPAASHEPLDPSSTDRGSSAEG